MLTASSRRALLPPLHLPLLYFAFAHVCLAAACAVLLVRPSIAGPFFLHPRMAALVHLVTVGWISGSILGAFYIVGPLALRMPMRSGRLDAAAFVSFALGTAWLIASFWSGQYARLGEAAFLVSAALLLVAVRAWLGLAGAVAPRPVKLHVALAFANVLVAVGLGVIVALDRAFGWYAWSPLSAAYAHAHLAAIGWALMMVVGLAYRLIPMILPAAMPARPTLVVSAVAIELGVVVLAVALIAGAGWAGFGLLLIVIGLASFVAHVHGMLAHRLPPPAALPKPDWATRQTHVALVCLVAAVAAGAALLVPSLSEWRVTIGWVYGTLGLVGFLAQIVVGIQGRLLPMHAWYGAFEAGGLKPPLAPAHGLGSPALARAVCLTWLAGVPLLAVGLASGAGVFIAAGAALLLAGTLLNAAQGARVLSKAAAAIDRSD